MLDLKGILEDRDNRIAITLILFIMVLTGSLAILSEGTYGGADDLSHYKIARYAFLDHTLFFDLWGKPLFTILASPFAQFGFKGVRIFNVIVSAGTLWFSYLVAKKFRVPFGWSVIILIAFAPLYLVMSYTGMTEILFGFTVIFSVWLFAYRRYSAAVIVLSFLPFVRNEGFVLWIPVIIALLSRSKYRLIPLFTTGFIVFSILGSLVFDDILWVIHRFPYRGAAEIYGNGTLFHFVKALPGSAGIPVLVLFVAGIIHIFKSLSRQDDDSPGFFFLWFIVLPALFYIAAHSFVWWRGIGSSAGLVRVLAGIIPLVSLTAALGMGFVAELINSYRIRALLPVAVILITVSIGGYRHHSHPTGLNDEELNIKKASYWIRSSGMEDRKIYYFSPFLPYFLGLDPYDTSLSEERVPDRDIPSNGIMPGALVAWDSHFGPQEGGVEESVLAGSNLFRIVASFGGELNNSIGQPRVAIYERLDESGLPGDSTADYLMKRSSDLAVSDSIIIPFIEFEGIVEDKMHRLDELGKYLIDSSQEFSPSLNIPLSYYVLTPLVKVLADVSIIPANDFGIDEILLVISLDRKGKPYEYLKQDLLENPGEDGYTGRLILNLPEEARVDDWISIYIWNKGKNTFYIDSFSVSLFVAGDDQ